MDYWTLFDQFVLRISSVFVLLFVIFCFLSRSGDRGRVGRWGHITPSKF